MAKTVDTYKVRRRMRMNDESYREYGDLIPEAHTWFTMESYLHSGEIEEAFSVPEADYRAAVKRYCPDLSDRVLAAVGLDPDVAMVGKGQTRTHSMVPVEVHENMDHEHVRFMPPKMQGGTPPPTPIEAPNTTIIPTSIAPGTPTPEPEHLGTGNEEDDMGTYDSAGDIEDPAAFNEQVTGTAPEDIKEHTKLMKGGLDTGTGDGVDKKPVPELTPEGKGDGHDNEAQAGAAHNPTHTGGDKAKNEDAKADSKADSGPAKQPASSHAPAKKAAAKKAPAKKAAAKPPTGKSTS